MKITGAELKDWYDNHFPEGFYHDDAEQEIYGGPTGDDFLLDPAKTYDTEKFGVVCPDSFSSNSEAVRSVTSVIRNWRKTKTHDTFAIEIPREAAAKVKAFVQKHKGKIL